MVFRPRLMSCFFISSCGWFLNRRDYDKGNFEFYALGNLLIRNLITNEACSVIVLITRLINKNNMSQFREQNKTKVLIFLTN